MSQRAAEVWTSNVLAGPVSIKLVFRFARPRNHYGSGRNAEKLKPSAPAFPADIGRRDLDKLARCALDALTGIVYQDDGQVTTLRCCKRFTSKLGQEGVIIEVGPEEIF